MVRLRMSAKALGVALALAVTAGGAVAAAGTPAGASVALPAGGTFGTPQPLTGIPGLGMTDPVFAGLRLSCTSVGDCGAIGGYTAKAAGKGTLAKQEAFVVTETNGHWGTPEAIPHLATLNTMGQVFDLQITCSAPGFCEAGGNYVTKLTATSGFGHAFVVQESKGIWGRARTFDTSGLSASANGASSLDALDCPSAGNCVAGGDYGSPEGSVPFIAVQRNGTWGKPELIPGMAALLGTAKNVVAGPRAISCTDSADCTVVGNYPSHGKMNAFIATETGGVWTDAAALPGLASLQSSSGKRYTDVDGIACDAGGGNCTVAGVFTSPQGQTLPFVLTKTNGTWGTVRQLPGTGKLNLNNGNGGGVRLACPTQATCTIATVAWTAASPAEPLQFGNSQVYLDAEVNGVWGTPRHLRGVPSGDGAGGTVTALSCGAPGFCTIGGYYGNATSPGVAFLAKERGGAWIGGPRKVAVPGAGRSTSQIGDLSCVAKGYCTATAFAQFPATAAGKPTGYLIAEGAASQTTLKLAKATITFGKEGAEKLTVAVSGPPGAKVAVLAGKTAVCAVTLTASGKPGTCTLSAKALKPGTYRLVAAYRGSAVYVASQSAAAKLTVLK